MGFSHFQPEELLMHTFKRITEKQNMPRVVSEAVSKLKTMLYEGMNMI